jgi:hypothetical protein
MAAKTMLSSGSLSGSSRLRSYLLPADTQSDPGDSLHCAVHWEPEQSQSQRLNNAVHTSLRVERRCSGLYQTTIMMSLFACEGG